MNEEEIINILTDDIVALNVGYEKYEEAVQGLLDLYNKEKERNKDLEQIEKEHKEENGRLREENEVLRYGLRENKILRHGLEENTEEIDKLYKIINLMAEQLTTPVHSKKWVIEYFTNKVEEDIKE